MNRVELKVAMTRKGIRHIELANQLNINPATLYNKMSGETEFTLAEVRNMKQILELSNEAFNDIFLIG